MSDPSNQPKGRYLVSWPRMKRLAALFWMFRWNFLIGAVFLVATNVLALQIPSLIGGTIQHLRDAESAGAAANFDLIQGNVLWIVLLAVGAAGARILSRIFVFNGGRQVEYVLRNQIFAHLTRLETAFYERSATGDLVSRTINDVNYVRVLFGLGSLHIVNTAVAYLIILTLMMQVSPKLTLWSLAPYPLFLIVMRLFARALYTRTQRVQAQLSDISSQAQENLSGMSVVKAFAIQPEASAQFREASDAYLDANMSLALVRGAMLPYMGSIGAIGTLIVLGFGGSLVVEAEITLGEFVEFSAYIVRLAWPTMALGWVIALWQRGMAGFDRLCHVLDTEPSVADPPLGRARALELDGPGPRGEIAFEDVSLTYEDGTVALDRVNLTIAAGSTVAIVGRTGAGKSSLVQLVPRLRDPSEGTVRVDGVPIQELTLDTLRGAIGYAPQTPFLFSTTIEENIRFGLLAREASAATRGEQRAGEGLSLEDAVRIAGLTDDIPAFPQGLETMVGERGITLSGGQKQRVTIARALLLDPTILILDDSLASVDTRTERRILDELSRIMRGRTSILVTHRFNALELVDEVIVLEDGRVVERGPHRELIGEGGVYAEMVERQRLEEELNQS
ncbi:MAG: ABC transporter ATP-binding protein [Myxococcales bacterium]|nr:ABC transporter ATP-binding protein [Myxococcales bacterium]